MFEQASRLKLRFATRSGTLSYEDLWDLPLITDRANQLDLDEVAKKLSREMKDSQEESFVSVKRTNEALELKFSMVKHVIKVRLEEKELRRARALASNEKEMLQEMLKKRKLDVLQELSVEEIEARLEKL